MTKKDIVKKYGLTMNGVYERDDPNVSNNTIIRCFDCNKMLLVFRTKENPPVYKDIECCGQIRIKANKG